MFLRGQIITQAGQTPCLVQFPQEILFHSRNDGSLRALALVVPVSTPCTTSSASKMPVAWSFPNASREGVREFNLAAQD